MWMEPCTGEEKNSTCAWLTCTWSTRSLPGPAARNGPHNHRIGVTEAWIRENASETVQSEGVKSRWASQMKEGGLAWSRATRTPWVLQRFTAGTICSQHELIHYKHEPSATPPVLTLVAPGGSWRLLSLSDVLAEPKSGAKWCHSHKKFL